MFGFTEYDTLIGYSLTTKKIIGTQGNRYVVNNKYCMKTEKRTKEKQYSKLLQSESPSNFSEHNTRIITFNQGIKDLRINNKEIYGHYCNFTAIL